MSAERTDEDLLRRTAHGDHDAFEDLVRRHAGPCARRARRLLACDDWVEDVLQAVWLDVWLHADRYRCEVGHVRGWLLAIVHHKAVDLVRAQERHASRWEHVRALDGHVDRAPDPADTAAQRDAERRLRAGVRALPEAPGRALQLCFLAELTQREAADRLSVPLGTVKTRSRSGVLELRRVLDPTLHRPA